MLPNIRLLLADSDMVFRDALASLLVQQGYQVTVATSPDETRTLLSERWFHLIILNVHLRDHNDPYDTSGLEILRNSAYQSIPKFLIANHPTVSMTREALKPGPTGVPMAVDFLGKEPEVIFLLSPLQDALKKHVHVNWALIIRQKETTSLLQVAQLIGPELSNAQVADRADELETAFRATFETAQQITLGRIFLHRPGYVVIEIIAHTPDVETYLVSCSRVGASDIERPLPSDPDQLEWQRGHVTAHFALHTCRLHSSGPLFTFREVCNFSKLEAVTQTVDSLLTKTLSRWHHSQRSFEPPDKIELVVRERLRLNIGALESRIAEICTAALANGIAQIVYDSHHIVLHLPDNTSLNYPNPAAIIGRRPLIVPSSPIACGLTHGPISGSAILLDSSGNCWFIDRDETGVGPILLDYAEFEMAVRVETMETISLAQRIHFEGMLLEDVFDRVPIELARPYEVISLIRRVAKIEPVAYTIGLFYAALSYTDSYQPQTQYLPSELTAYTHMLLLAAMLSERLVAREHIPPQAVDSLWIDPETNEVWVEGRRVELTPQEHAMLIYLYHNARQRRSRKQMIEALGEQVDDVIGEESRLNSAISRLRSKIESDPDHPKYLHTIRGYGYRLDV